MDIPVTAEELTRLDMLMYSDDGNVRFLCGIVRRFAGIVMELEQRTGGRPVEASPEVAAEVVRLHEGGANLGAIQDALNLRGVKTRKGKPWSARAIKNVLASSVPTTRAAVDSRARNTRNNRSPPAGPSPQGPGSRRPRTRP